MSSKMKILSNAFHSDERNITVEMISDVEAEIEQLEERVEELRRVVDGAVENANAIIAEPDMNTDHVGGMLLEIIDIGDNAIKGVFK